MTESIYGKYVVTELKTPDFPAEFVKKYNEFATRILWMDKDVVPGAFQMNCSWYRKPLPHAGEPHQHDVDEILGFFGSDASKPYDLGGEIELWLGDTQHIITSTAMVFIPAGMKHCPLILRRVDRPIFHFSTVTGGQYVLKSVEKERKPELDSSRYIVRELKMPEDKKKIHQEYIKYATRVLWLDKDVVPGAYNMNTAWYLKAAETLENVPHTHDNDEIIGFFGNDYTKPHDLGGEVEIWLEDEKQIISKSAMIFVPAGMKHCPLILRRVDRPIFHFSVVIAGQYIKDEEAK
jgi:mannose-6-phosphate isomerase-like protein (cupin superfamily)